MGFPGKFDDIKFKDAIKKVTDLCKANNFPSGFHIVETNSIAVQTRIDEGFTFLAYGIDYMFMRDAAVNGIKKIKR